MLGVEIVTVLTDFRLISEGLEETPVSAPNPAVLEPNELFDGFRLISGAVNNSEIDPLGVAASETPSSVEPLASLCFSSLRIA